MGLGASGLYQAAAGYEGLKLGVFAKCANFGGHYIVFHEVHEFREFDVL